MTGLFAKTYQWRGGQGCWRSDGPYSGGVDRVVEDQVYVFYGVFLV
jgi:hypothetical protein